MLSVDSLQVGHRYLFLDVHVDGDEAYEAYLEEVSPSGQYIKLRFPNGEFDWEDTADINVVEELGQPVRKEIIFKWVEKVDEKDAGN